MPKRAAASWLRLCSWQSHLARPAAVVFDHFGYQATFALSSGLLILASALAFAVARLDGAPLVVPTVLQERSQNHSHFRRLKDRAMRRLLLIVAGLTTLGSAHVMAKDLIELSSQWGTVTAELSDNAAARELVRMLPITIEMRDHLRQEKTGNLPGPLLR